MKSFRCGDVVAGCTRSFAGSEDDILAQVSQHAANDHGVARLSDSMMSQVRSAMVPIVG